MHYELEEHCSETPLKVEGEMKKALGESQTCTARGDEYSTPEDTVEMLGL